MPIYEYKCSKCGKELEVMHKVSDPAPVECPECKSQNTLEKLVSRTSFQLKGGGWYSDLYGSSKKSDSSSSSSGNSSSAASSTSSSPATPAASTSTSTPAASSSSSSGSGSGGTGGTGSSGS